MRLFATLALSGLSSLPSLATLRVNHGIAASGLFTHRSRHLAQPLLRRCPRRAAPAIACAASPDKDVLSVNTALDFSLPFRVLAFYAIAPIDDPDAAVTRHRAFLAKRDMVGRVYLCADGLNAQVSGTAQACLAYREFVGGDEFPLERLVFKEDPIEELAFPKLRVKHKGLVPAPKSGDAVELHDRGVDLSPDEWAAKLDAADAEGTVVLDVRNSYEWDVGRFANAEKPSLDHFTDFDPETYGLPTDDAAKKDTPVMMYCTGGIRCEYFSARLKAAGFEKVYKLQGGVQHYGNQMGNREAAQPARQTVAADLHLAPADATREATPEAGNADAEATPHWKGSLFVFDRRNTLRFGAEGAGGGSPEPIGTCMHCSVPSESFLNCANVDCNMLHLVCPACLAKHRGFCSEACQSAPRRRPLDLLASTVDGKIDFDAAIAATQGARPGDVDPNKLSTFKPDNLPRHAYDADRHTRDGEPKA